MRRKGVVFVLLLLMSSGSRALWAQSIVLQIEGERVITPVAPVIEEGTTLVPLRVISENLGAKVDYEEQSRIVTIRQDKKEIVLQIENHSVRVNEEDRQLVVAPKLVEGTTMVPIRFISEQLGCQVVWDEGTKIIDITRQEEVSLEDTSQSEEERLLALLKQKSAYQTTMQDDQGTSYEIYVYADDESKTQASFANGNVWAGASDGDQLATGQYQVYYTPVGTTHLKVYEPVELHYGMTRQVAFNLTRENIKVVKTVEEEQFLILAQTQSSNSSAVYFYRIIEGELRNIPFHKGREAMNGMSMWSGNAPWFKFQEAHTLLCADYSNAEDVGFKLYGWQYDEVSQTFSAVEIEVPSEHLTYEAFQLYW